MPKGKSSNLIGAWAFLIGVIFAIVFAFFPPMTWVSWLLFFIGLIIGLLNIADAEVKPFLMAGAVLVIVSALGGNTFATLPYIPVLLGNMLVLFVPATIVVALKSVFSMARN